MNETRMYCDAVLGAGADIALSEGQARKALSVLRLRDGDHVRLFNARDGEWRGALTRLGKHGAQVRLTALLRAPTVAPDLMLAFAPIKRDGTDWLVEKATELGVRILQPVMTERTIVDVVRLERLEAIAQSAAEQCERFDLPQLRESVTLPALLAAWPEGRGLIYADESGDEAGAPWGGATGRGAPIAEALRNLSAGPIGLLTGPEGGFSPEERRLLRQQSFVTPVSLGPRILRAETAALAGLAVIQALAGDWAKA